MGLLICTAVDDFYYETRFTGEDGLTTIKEKQTYDNWKWSKISKKTMIHLPSNFYTLVGDNPILMAITRLVTSLGEDYSVNITK